MSVTLHVAMIFIKIIYCKLFLINIPLVYRSKYNKDIMHFNSIIINSFTHKNSHYELVQPSFLHPYTLTLRRPSWVAEASCP